MFHLQSFLDYHAPGKFEFTNYIIRHKEKIIAVLPGGYKENGTIYWSPIGASYGSFVTGDIPFELALKEYFKYKYDQNNANLFLQETLFAGTGSIQHHYVSLFVSERLMENYSSEHKYKQCYLVSERMRNLNESRRIYLKF
jgi:hypothetical protein